MTHVGEIYLALVIAAFLSFAATLFWQMVNDRRRPPDDHGRRAEPYR
jgi:hypothetical protein